MHSTCITDPGIGGLRSPKVVEYGARYWHVANVREPDEVEADLLALLAEAYREMLANRLAVFTAVHALAPDAQWETYPPAPHRTPCPDPATYPAPPEIGSAATEPDSAPSGPDSGSARRSRPAKPESVHWG